MAFSQKASLYFSSWNGWLAVVLSILSIRGDAHTQLQREEKKTSDINTMASGVSVPAGQKLLCAVTVQSGGDCEFGSVRITPAIGKILTPVGAFNLPSVDGFVVLPHYGVINILRRNGLLMASTTARNEEQLDQVATTIAPASVVPLTTGVSMPTTLSTAVQQVNTTLSNITGAPLVVTSPDNSTLSSILPTTTLSPVSLTTNVTQTLASTTTAASNSTGQTAIATLLTTTIPPNFSAATSAYACTWGAWSVCSGNCGNCGTQQRFNTCNITISATQFCNPQVCLYGQSGGSGMPYPGPCCTGFIPSIYNNNFYCVNATNTSSLQRRATGSVRRMDTMKRPTRIN